MPTNDNELTEQSIISASPDAHGKAALLLVESLLHGLCESATLTTAQAAEIAERALDVQLDQGEAVSDAGPMLRAHALLENIAASLNVDRPQDPTT